MDDPVEAFREMYRATKIPPSYRGKLHLALTTTLTVGGALVALSQVHAPSLAQLLTVPVAFLVANVTEYLGHRYPMHRRFRGLEAV